MSASSLLELLNGGAVTPEMLWLVLLGVYLSKEAKRRGLRAVDWFSLPPSMNLILAVFISDLGVTLRSATVWAWRRFNGGAGDFSSIETAALIVGGTLIVVGSLCKIRAITEPDHGNGPWLLSMASAVVAILVLLALR